MADPQWNEAGEPANLEAAAADAGKWLELVVLFVEQGKWKFSEPDSLERLRSCRIALAALSPPVADGGYK